jgi:hypothetical protein
MRVTHNKWQGCNTHSAVCACNRLAAVALFPLCLHGSEPLAFHMLLDLDRILAQAIHTSSYADAFEAPPIGFAACHGPYSVMNVLQGSTAFQPSSRAVQYMAACNIKYQSKNAYASLLRIVAHETGSVVPIDQRGIRVRLQTHLKLCKVHCGHSQRTNIFVAIQVRTYKLHVRDDIAPSHRAMHLKHARPRVKHTSCRFKRL